MAVLVSQVVDAVLGAVDSSAGPQIVAGWCSERYRELTNRSRFRHLLKVGELVMPAAVIAGTVSLTAGSNIVTGDATAKAAWALLASSIIDRQFRASSQRNWFRITGINGSGNLILESNYVTPFGTAPATITGVGYVIAVRFHSLAEDLRHMGVFSHQRLLTPLEEISHQELDEAMTARVLVADIPRYVCEQGVDKEGHKIVEIYPYAKTDQLIRYSYHTFSPDLRLDSTLPAEIDLHVLKTGALVDLFRWEMTKALRANQPEIAATWRNEMNTMVTRWEDKIREAVKADRGSDVLSFQFITTGFPASDDRRVRNAYDYVWQKGNRP